MKGSAVAVVIVVGLIILGDGGGVLEAEAVSCKAIELASCATAITSSTPPSKLCCTKLKEQKPCLCQYLKNPNLKRFVNSPNARKVAVTCGTPYPKC